MTQPEPLKQEPLVSPILRQKRYRENLEQEQIHSTKKRLRCNENSLSFYNNSLKNEIEDEDEQEITIIPRETAKNPSGLSFREAAVEILKDLDRPLAAKELITRILSAGLVSTTGKTPDRTLASLIYSDIRVNGAKSRFRKVAKGLFGLTTKYYPKYDNPKSSSSIIKSTTTSTTTTTTTTPLNSNKTKPKRPKCKTISNRKRNTSSKTSSICTVSSSTPNTILKNCLLCSKSSNLIEHPLVPDMMICSNCCSNAKWKNKIQDLYEDGSEIIHGTGLCGVCGTEQEQMCPRCDLPCCPQCLIHLQRFNALDKVSHLFCSECNTFKSQHQSTLTYSTTSSYFTQEQNTTVESTPNSTPEPLSETESLSSTESIETSENKQLTTFHRYSFGSEDSKMPFKRTRNEEEEQGFLFLQYFLYINRRQKLQHQNGTCHKHHHNNYDEPEDDCFNCKNGGELIVCDFPQCNKVYHKTCANMSNIPSGKWFCPRHYCDTCLGHGISTGPNAIYQCLTCPTSFCKSHLSSNVTKYGSGVLCSRCRDCLEREIKGSI